MNSSFDRSEKNKDEWLTPRYITDFFDADLDPCSPMERRPWDTAKNHIGLPIDGLKCDWGSNFVWCNPPYGKETFKWIKKCSEHRNSVALIFARTETKGFHSEIWNKADALFFFEGRLKFHHVDGTQGDSAGAPSVLVAYGELAKNKLKKFSEKYKGKFISLEQK